jgi:hypothetical protein
MTQMFNDGWAVGGSGSGYTHMKDGTTTLYRRIDYLFFDKASGMKQTGIKVAGRLADSDHVAVVATYSVPSTAVVPATTTSTQTTTPVTTPSAPTAPAATETTLFADRFDTFDATQWPARVITGTQDNTIPLTLVGGMLQVGELKAGVSGTHYNGVSTAAYNLASNGCASVELAQSVNPASTAYAMFAVVRDSNNLYRWYQVGDSLVAEKKVNGVKTTLVDLQYAVTTHQFLRIRKVANAATGTHDVVFETAPNVNGVPGTYTERYRNTWDASVNASGLKMEIKAGTSGVETAAGSAYWDNVVIAANCK